MQFLIEIYDPEIIVEEVEQQLAKNGVGDVIATILPTYAKFLFTGNFSQVTPIVQKISKNSRLCPVDILTRNKLGVCSYTFVNGRMMRSQQGISPNDWAALKGYDYSLEVMRFLTTTSKKQSVSQFGDFLRSFVETNDLIGIWTFEEIKKHVLNLLANLSGYVSS